MTRCQVLEALRAGEVLHMEWADGKRSFWIGDQQVMPHTATEIISSDLLCGCDGLFDFSPQSWVLISPTE